MPRLIVLGGVPGSGKSTTLRGLPREGSDGVPGTEDDVHVLDPEDLAAAWRDRIPDAVPYRVYRPLVHTWHGARVVGHLVAGAVLGRRTHPVVVHDPATRGWRRFLLTRIARWCGYAPELVLLRVSRDEADQGQLIRGRSLSAESNDRHWAGHEELRARLDHAVEHGTPAPDQPGTVPWSEGWAEVYRTDRAGVGELLRSLVGRSRSGPARPPDPGAGDAADATTTRTRPRRTRRR